MSSLACMSAAQGRKKVVVVKSFNGYPVGTRLQMRAWKAEELKEFVKEYNGPWGREHKVKINLNELK